MQKNPFKSLLQRVDSILLDSLPSEVESARKARWESIGLRYLLSDELIGDHYVFTVQTTGEFQYYDQRKSIEAKIYKPVESGRVTTLKS